MDPVEDLIAEQLGRARARLDAGVFDYFAGGSGQELALDEAVAAWSRFRFRPRVLRDVSDVDVSTTLFGQRLAGPVGVAPVAFQGLLDADGEVATARGARAAGSLLVVSTRASRPVEDIAAAAGPWWLQVYLTADRRLIEGLVRRAVDAGASALVLTGDTPYVARKRRAERPLPLDAAEAMGNLGRHLPADADPTRAAEQDPAAGLDAIGRLAELSGLPVLVKGVLRADDATACLDAGASGLIVSNHGGRQLDRALATAFALRDVAGAAGDVPVLVDGGVRSAFDVLTALALGADGVLIGRPAAWALACDGAEGVARLLAAFAADLRHVLGLAGCTRCSEVSADLVEPTR